MLRRGQDRERRAIRKEQRQLSRLAIKGRRAQCVTFPSLLLDLQITEVLREGPFQRLLLSSPALFHMRMQKDRPKPSIARRTVQMKRGLLGGLVRGVKMLSGVENAGSLEESKISVLYVAVLSSQNCYFLKIICQRTFFTKGEQFLWNCGHVGTTYKTNQSLKEL